MFVKYKKEEIENVINALNQLVVPVSAGKIIGQVIDYLANGGQLIQEEKKKEEKKK